MAFHDSRFVSGWIVGVPMPGAQQNATGQGQIKAGRIKFLYALFFFILYSLSPSPSPSSSTSLFQVPGILIWLIHLSVNECASLSDCSSRIIHSSWRRQQCHYCTHTAPISQRSSTDFQHWRKKHIFGNVHRIKVWLSQKKKKIPRFHHHYTIINLSLSSLGLWYFPLSLHSVVTVSSVFSFDFPMRKGGRMGRTVYP